MKTTKIFLSLVIGITITACSQKPADNSESVQKAELRIVSLNDKKLPKGIKYEGDIQQVIHYTDAMGDNYVFTTKTDVYTKKKKDEYGEVYELKNVDLYAYHYVVNEDESVKLIWKVTDYVHDCDFDIMAEFVNNTFNVTDLDENGTAEIWVMYVTTCTSDMSPNTMKVIMYEGEQKYAMRGTDKIEFGDEKYGGEYEFDSAFKNADQAFKDYAKQLWKDNILQESHR
ncbi:MAG: hypothetical protein LBN18_04800 [Dysgonamonadaceae bacterium]|jgi:hypothetical protein|nr:hypothetical protein [Dysgonamonadaceae bacterium]